jgi:hypothetical protein
LAQNGCFLSFLCQRFLMQQQESKPNSEVPPSHAASPPCCAGDSHDDRGVCLSAHVCVCACVMHACRLGCSSGATHVVLHKQEDTAATARRLHNQRTFPSYSRRMIFLATCCQTVAFRWRGSKAPERSQLFQFVSISCFRIVLFRMCCSYLFGSFLSNSIKTIKVLIS